MTHRYVMYPRNLPSYQQRWFSAASAKQARGRSFLWSFQGLSANRHGDALSPCRITSEFVGKSYHAAQTFNDRQMPIEHVQSVKTNADPHQQTPTWLTNLTNMVVAVGGLLSYTDLFIVLVCLFVFMHKRWCTVRVIYKYINCVLIYLYHLLGQQCDL